MLICLCPLFILQLFIHSFCCYYYIIFIESLNIPLEFSGYVCSHYMRVCVLISLLYYPNTNITTTTTIYFCSHCHFYP